MNCSKCNYFRRKCYSLQHRWPWIKINGQQNSYDDNITLFMYICVVCALFIKWPWVVSQSLSRSHSIIVVLKDGDQKEYKRNATKSNENFLKHFSLLVCWRKIHGNSWYGQSSDYYILFTNFIFTTSTLNHFRLCISIFTCHRMPCSDISNGNSKWPNNVFYCGWFCLTLYTIK